MGYTPSSTPYADPSDLPVFGSLSAAALASPNTGNAQQLACILAQSEYVDTFLRDQFQLPLKTWGADIKGAVCKLAAYDLICLRGFNPNNEGDKVFADRAKDARDWLKLVAQGTVRPDVTDSSPNAGIGTPAPDAGPVVTSPSAGFMGVPSTRGTSRR